MTDTNPIIYDYQPPVSSLLTLGEEPARQREWPAYGKLGLRQEHIPQLIRMATDEGLFWANTESLEVWAPLHAWRALGQLQAVEAIEPLTALYRYINEGEDDWSSSELPTVYGMIGPPAIPTLAKWLNNHTYNQWVTANIAEALVKIGQRHPQTRAECALLITAKLEQFADNDPGLNGLLIGSLLDLKAVEAAPVIEAAYQADAVELPICGDWEDTQVELGLLKKRITPAPNYTELEMGPEKYARFMASMQGLEAQVRAKQELKQEQQHQAKTKAKARQKRKQAKKQRKQQRKKKKR